MEEFDDERGALRLGHALIGMAGILAFVALAWTARALEGLAIPATWFWVICGPWLLGYAALLALIYSGHSRRFEDPSLTEAQMLWTALGVLALYPLAPQLAGLCHLALLLVGLFGTFQMSNLRHIVSNLLVMVGAAAAFTFNYFAWPGIGDTVAAQVNFVAFLLAMAVATALGMELNDYRRLLVQRNDQLMAATGRFRALATRDELVGVHNRRFLRDILQQQKAQHDRRAEQVFSVCFLDLDHFKRVNDIFGHATGDLVLKRFAEIARKALREEDYIGRWGGDEFVLVLVWTSSAGAALVAERIREDMSGLAISDEVPDYRISASFGVSEHRRGESVEDTLARADAALYEAKRAGRNRVVLAEDPGPGAA